MASGAMANKRIRIPKKESTSIEDRIRERAHQLWLQRGDIPGSAMEDWLIAEQEVLEEEGSGARAEE